ncbi:GNAT family N-acetyltransferase [Salininema proteolyticum]|uniref:GNAT family N-acetyltransferase n=1 Tax=Salininema proteolyticum TaxID=1607685 RepID=A0ABV8U394_9ACTN
MTTPPDAELSIDSLSSDEDAEAFRSINEEWITKFFTLIEADRKLLDDPRGRVIAHGGDVLMARLGGATVGCVALIPYPSGVFELSKMGVSPVAQGRGIGRDLVAAAVRRARELGAVRVFLGTNSALAPAVHLYEEAGFTRVSRDALPVEDYYARADVLMELRLK